jgi:hypothetical protein
MSRVVPCVAVIALGSENKKKLNHEFHECPFSRKFLKKKWGAQNVFLKEIQQLYEFETIRRRRAAGAARLRRASVHFHVFSLFFRSLSAATGRGVAWGAI